MIEKQEGGVQGRLETELRPHPKARGGSQLGLIQDILPKVLGRYCTLIAHIFLLDASRKHVNIPEQKPHTALYPPHHTIPHHITSPVCNPIRYLACILAVSVGENRKNLGVSSHLHSCPW